MLPPVSSVNHSAPSGPVVIPNGSPDEVGIEVRDDGTGATSSDGYGHGLIGIRERVRLYGGEMTAGTTNGGGFTLSTRLPLTPDRP